MDKRSALVVSVLSLFILFSFRGYAEPTYTNNISSLVTTYSPTTYSNFSITWNDASFNNALLENNFTGSTINTTMSGTYPDYYYNSSVLGANTYSYRFIGIDTSNNVNAAPILTFTISKAAAPTVNLYLNGSTSNVATSTYPNSTINVTAVSSISGLYVQLWRNDTLLDNEINTSWNISQWPAWNNNFTAQVVDQNYTDSTPVTLWWNVSKASTNISLYLNGTQGNRAYASNDTANFTVILNVSGNVNLSSNYIGWVNQSGFSPLFNYTSFYSVGNLWYLTASFDGNENYTASSPITYYFNVTDATPPSPSNSATNTNVVNSPALFSMLWADNAGLSGYIFSFDNCTGSFINDTWTNNGGQFTGTSAWSNVTKTINSTVGCTVQWEIYANDTSNNWNYLIAPSFITKLADGSSCTVDSQCSNFCLHNVCRPTNPFCGDTHCDSGESCSSCSADCGACTTTPPTSSGSNPTGSFLINNLASSLTVLTGQSASTTFTLSDTLSNNIASVNISVSGIDSSWYTLSNTTISILKRNVPQSMTITFNIPGDATTKDYDVTISAKGKALGETTTRTATKTIVLTVNSSQPQPIQPLPSVTETPPPQLSAVQENKTENITSNKTSSVATGLVSAFEFFKNNLVIILAVAVCLLIFMFRNNLTTALGGTLGSEEAEKTHKSTSPLKAIKDKLSYKIVLNLKKESKAKSLKEPIKEAEAVEKVPEAIHEANAPEKETKRPAILEKEIKRDIKELQSILDAEEKVKKNKKKFTLGNN